MKLFVKNLIKVLLVFVIGAMLISSGSLWSLKQSSFYKPYFLANSVDDDQLDYIVLGSSTGLTTLNTKLIDSILKTNGLNLSMDDTSLPSQFLMLQHFIAEGKKTKLCVLAPNPFDFDTKTYRLSDNDYRFIAYSNRPYVHDYYKQFNEKRAEILSLSRSLPFVGVSYYNMEIFYPSLFSLFNPEKRNRFDVKGNYTYPAAKREFVKKNDETELSIEFKNAYLDKIKALCKQNEIELICYISPIETKKIRTTTTKYNVINHSSLFYDTNLYYDDIHVNRKGRKISTKEFAREFKAYFNK